MNKYIITVLAFLVVAISVSCSSASRRQPKPDDSLSTPPIVERPSSQIVEHPSLLTFDSLDWKIPLGDQYRTTLANGAIAYVAVDSLLPLINIEAYIRSGSLTNPIGREGIGSLLARLLRSGGTAQYPAAVLDSIIDLYAMRFSFSQAETHIKFNASFLSEFADTAMNIMDQMFFSPVFQEERIERERSIMIENIRHRFANPAPALSAAYRKHQYPQTAASRLMTAASLESITRGDLTALHENAFGANGMILAVSGKFCRDEMLAKLNNIFAKPPSTLAAQFPEIAIAPETRALVVHHPSNQAHIRMGVPLFKRPHDDYYAVMVMNYILGGSGFTSRLGTRIRSDEGLTYSIRSTAESNYTYDGTMFIGFFTRIELYPKAISIILEEIDKLITDGITESELEHARSALISELPSSFRSPEDIVSTYAWSEFFGREPDHYVKYPDELMKLTTEDLKNAAWKYINIDKITYTIVGDTTAINAANVAAAADGFFTIDALNSKRVVVADSIVSLP
ncbi:MAG: insulinase family protein [Chitinispirillales bacterium]|nr:insulinase family protein [Chitinispirillales bacterium]